MRGSPVGDGFAGGEPGAVPARVTQARPCGLSPAGALLTDDLTDNHRPCQRRARRGWCALPALQGVRMTPSRTVPHWSWDHFLMRSLLLGLFFAHKERS